MLKIAKEKDGYQYVAFLRPPQNTLIRLQSVLRLFFIDGKDARRKTTLIQENKKIRVSLWSQPTRFPFASLQVWIVYEKLSKAAYLITSSNYAS